MDHVRRRRLIAGFGGVVALGSLAGCAGLMGGPELEITELDAETTAPGGVTLVVSVTNSGNREGSARLFAEVEVEGGATHTDSRVVSVGPNESKDYRFDFEVGEVASDAEYTYNARLERA